MGSVTKFAAINTKVKALKGKMLTKKDYENLISQKSVKDIVTYLVENTSYKYALQNIDTEDIHRGNLELYLKRYMVIQYEKLLHYLIGEYRKLFKIIFMKFEIEDIKLYLRTLDKKEDLKNISDLILYSGTHSNIDHDKLISSKDIESFVENLKDTMYYSALHPYLKEKEDRRVFYLEMNLDRLYFSKLYEQVTRLNTKDREHLEKLLGKNIDILNIEWTYRGLKFFNISPEELLNYALKGGYKISYDCVKKLSYVKSEEEFIKVISETPYYFLFKDRNTIDLFMELRLESYLYSEFLNYFHKENLDITMSISYIHLLEYEIRDIISLTESIRYDLDKKEILPYLIKDIEGDEV